MTMTSTLEKRAPSQFGGPSGVKGRFVLALMAAKNGGNNQAALDALNLQKGEKVLEIGLGYGTLSQYLAECGAIYSGLDIAADPVGMVNHRLALLDTEGGAQVGSALDIPHTDDSFDFVVIGDIVCAA